MSPMRFALIAAALSMPSSLTSRAGAKDIQTGAELSGACEVYASAAANSEEAAGNAADPCRKFLQGFLVAFKAGQEAELAERTSNPTAGPKATQAPCVRMPDTLTYVEFAQRIVAYGRVHTPALNATASGMAQATLQNDFPCKE